MAENTITINVRDRLLRLHSTQRRRRISGYVKQAVARFAKADIDLIKIDGMLSRHLILHIARKPVSFKVTVEKLENRVNVRLPGTPKAEAKPSGKPVAKPETKSGEAKVKPETKTAKSAEPAKPASKPVQETKKQEAKQ